MLLLSRLGSWNSCMLIVCAIPAIHARETVLFSACLHAYIKWEILEFGSEEAISSEVQGIAALDFFDISAPEPA